MLILFGCLQLFLDAFYERWDVKYPWMFLQSRYILMRWTSDRKLIFTWLWNTIKSSIFIYWTNLLCNTGIQVLIYGCLYVCSCFSNMFSLELGKWQVVVRDDKKTTLHSFSWSLCTGIRIWSVCKLPPVLWPCTWKCLCKHVFCILLPPNRIAYPITDWWLV